MAPLERDGASAQGQRTPAGDDDSGESRRKAFQTTRARAALAGFTLTELPDGAFAVERWGFTRELRSLTEVDAFLARAGRR